MVTSVEVTPLCGVYSESPLCYLLSVDGFNFLMDSGWNDLCDLNLVQSLSRVAPTVDAVLVSHPDVLHLGPLPYAMKHLGLSAPVYSTEPVYRLGLLTMYDHYIARRVEFAGGALRCGSMSRSGRSTIPARRVALVLNKWSLKAPLMEQYYKIRDLLSIHSFLCCRLMLLTSESIIDYP